MDNHKSDAVIGALNSSVLDRALAGLSEAGTDLTNARKPSDLFCDPHLNPLPEGRNAAPQTRREAELARNGCEATPKIREQAAGLSNPGVLGKWWIEQSLLD